MREIFWIKEILKEENVYIKIWNEGFGWDNTKPELVIFDDDDWFNEKGRRILCLRTDDRERDVRELYEMGAKILRCFYDKDDDSYHWYRTDFEGVKLNV